MAKGKLLNPRCLHPKCPTPNWWQRLQQGIKSGARWTCPLCGVMFYYTSFGFGLGGAWIPDGSLNSTKVYAIRGEKVSVGQIPIGEMSSWLLTPDEIKEVNVYKERWLKWDER